eukprot:g1039.t1
MTTTLANVLEMAKRDGDTTIDVPTACFTLGYLAGERYREARNKRACVTGGSGFLGSWCVKMLLDRGFTVHCTTRSESKAKYLNSLAGAKERLKIFSGCDLLKPGSFDDAVRGCAVVLHTASPFFTHGGSVENLIRPALEGTKNVLDSCARLNVDRVVLTSSTAAVYAGYGKWTHTHVYTEADWSPEDRMLKANNFYCLSKTRAEKYAWEFAKSATCTFQLAVMNPTLIWGPMLPSQPHFNTSCAALVGLFDGSKKEIPSGTKAVVDVRDVADAHVIAAEDSACRLSCWGERMLLISASPSWKEVAGEIKRALPDDLAKNVPSKVSDEIGPTTLGAPPPHPTLFDDKRAVAHLQRRLRSTDEMVRTCVRSMVENGFVSSKSYVPGK